MISAQKSWSLLPHTVDRSCLLLLVCLRVLHTSQIGHAIVREFCCAGCRKGLAATLRAQIGTEMEAEAAEKPAMPTYGTAVR